VLKSTLRATLDHPSEHGIAAIYLCCSLHHAAQPRWHLESLRAPQHRPQRETPSSATARQQPNFPSIDNTSIEGCAKDSLSSSKLVGTASVCRSSRYGAVLFKCHIKAVVIDCYRATELFSNQRDHGKLSGVSMPLEMKTGPKIGSATRHGKSLVSYERYERETLSLESMRYGAPRTLEP
jgi:hypothetical protein